MKNIFWAIFFLMVGTLPAAAQRTDAGLSIPEQLGITAGIAQACNVNPEMLKNYELIASRLIANPAPTAEIEYAELQTYAQAKLEALKGQKKTPQLSCSEVLARFENQPLFQSVVFKDGTVKLPDGKLIKPVRTAKKKKAGKK